jgi:predicted nucleotidyltransferase
MTTRDKTSKLLAEFKRELARLYGDRLKGVFLYGSRARGEAEPEADVDILLCLTIGTVTEPRSIAREQLARNFRSPMA